jgi:hypothetical protein
VTATAAIRTGYGTIVTLPSDVAWRQDYQAEFGSAPTALADLYFDAASLLLLRPQQVSRIVKGNLVIDRAELATMVRNTTKFQGVTCAITLDPLTVTASTIRRRLPGARRVDACEC